jgi:hypothetical protein
MAWSVGGDEPFDDLGKRNPGADAGSANLGNLPTYMAVIVSSSIAKSQDRISGDTVHLVIVKVDPHGGTGTVIGSVPGC